MTCDEFRRGVMDVLEGESPGVSVFEDHAVSCPRCRALLRRIRENERILREAAVPPVPGDLWSRIASGIGAPGAGLRRRRAAVLAAAAGLAAALSLFFVAFPPRGGELDLVVRDAGPALGPLVPRDGDVETAQALAGVSTASWREDWR